MTKQQLKQIIKETIEEIGLFNKQPKEVTNLIGAKVIRSDKNPSTGEITLQLVGKDGSTTYTAVLK